MFSRKHTHFLKARTPGASRTSVILAEESGITLIEVVISALLVGLIAAGTITGFATAGKATYDERAHAQATICAQQDEERLRGLTAVKLGSLEKEGTETRKVTENCETYTEGSGYTGTVFTVTSYATYYTETSSGAVEACTSESGNANYLRTVSSVTWLGLGSRPPVTESSQVSTPLSAALLVRVQNQLAEPVEGATVSIVNGTSGVNLSQTTGSGGCVIFGTVNANTVTLTVSKLGWVTSNGQESYSKSIKVSGDSTTPKTVQIGDAGGISVMFKNSSTGLSTFGDTFIAFQSGIPEAPEFMLEGTAGTYLPEVASPKLLFPFQTVPVAPSKTPGENPYHVYAGDCTANNPETYGIKAEKAQVEPGGSKEVTVEEPPVTMTVYKGTTIASGVATGAEVKITNTGCKNVIPVNYSSSETYARVSSVSTTGHLEHETQPYGAFELCIASKEAVSGKYYKYTTTFTNKAKAGVALGNIFLGSATSFGSKQTC